MGHLHFRDDASDLSSTETLLKHEEDSVPGPLQRAPRKLSWKTIVLHAVAIAVYGLVATLVTIHFNVRRRGQYLVYSPANPAVEYEERLYSPNLNGDPKYFGTPSDFVDSNWADLMVPSTIHLTEADKQHFDDDEPVVQFPDGTYYGSLWVYHELHCLKRLYQYMNEDYYFPNLTDHEKVLNRRHTEHCFGTLRQGIMCHGDVTVMRMKWGKSGRVPLGDFSNPHQCVNFEKVHEWAMQRAVTNDLEPGVLVHPTLGPSFPDGKGTKIGFGDEDIDEDGNVITLNSPDR